MKTSKKRNLHKIGKHGAMGILTQRGTICVECHKPIKMKNTRKTVKKDYEIIKTNAIYAGQSIIINGIEKEIVYECDKC
jgi:hypothetical protein